VVGRTFLDIAIVGCGPSGMAAALFLSRAGHRVRIFERFDAPRPIGSGLLLQPTGLAVLQRLELIGKVARAGARIDRLAGTALPSGRMILSVAYADLGDGLHGIGIHRASLFDILHDAVLAGGIEIIPSSPVASIEQASGARPALLLASGRKAGPFDLVIDAAGAQSALRSVENGARPHPFAYGAIWTTLPLADHPFDPSALAQRYRAAREMVGVLPVGSLPGSQGQHVAFFWSLRMDRLEAWRERGLAAWKDEVSRLWPDAGSLIAGIDAPERMTPAFYAHYTARRPGGPHVVSIGDAAHCTSPQLGQGANMGLVDAFALAAALARHVDTGAAIAACLAARRRHIRFYQAASWWLTALFQSDSRSAAAARDFAGDESRPLFPARGGADHGRLEDRPLHQPRPPVFARKLSASAAFFTQ
jgi:2-polyprenyl-6-methoxyphenol hydroxylase-like FAD-dependent oxidoreductase